MFPLPSTQKGDRDGESPTLSGRARGWVHALRFRRAPCSQVGSIVPYSGGPISSYIWHVWHRHGLSLLALEQSLRLSKTYFRKERLKTLFLCNLHLLRTRISMFVNPTSLLLIILEPFHFCLQTYWLLVAVSWPDILHGVDHCIAACAYYICLITYPSYITFILPSLPVTLPANTCAPIRPLSVLCVKSQP